MRAQDDGCRMLLALAQRIIGQAAERDREVWIVTRDAQDIVETDSCGGFANATVWGLARTLALEHPRLRWIRVDVDDTTASRESLADLLQRGSVGR